MPEMTLTKAVMHYFEIPLAKMRTEFAELTDKKLPPQNVCDGCGHQPTFVLKKINGKWYCIWCRHFEK